MRLESVLEITEHDTLPVLLLTGEISSEAGDKIREAYSRACARDGHDAVVFDFSGVRYINSEGVAIFFSLVRNMNEDSSKIVLVSLTPTLRSIVNVVGLADFVHIADDTDAWFAHRT
jgi:anti-anti-sigma factor